jgi:Rha family phage regulatory protein
MMKDEEFGIVVKNNVPKVSSRFVAEYFGKRHDNVLQDIRNLDCSEEFRLLNFQESSYKNEQNKKQPEVLMTRDGFIFLVMGYKGKKAAKIKEAYIRAFNRMEEYIKTRLAIKDTHKEMNEAARIDYLERHPGQLECPSHVYINENDVICRVLFGMQAHKYKEKLGIDPKANLRDELTHTQRQLMEILERVNESLIRAGFTRDERFERLKVVLQKETTRRSLNAGGA